MIDIEQSVFSTVSAKLHETYPGVFATGEYVKSPPSFPCVSLVEADNQVYRNSQTTDSMENHAVVLYELNVYSNKKKGKKAECKELVALIDKELVTLGFTRIMSNPLPNEGGATIYRMVARYSAVVSKNNVIYRR